MDLEDRDLAALEERLYSSIHHSFQDPQPVTQEPAPVPPPHTQPTRVVSKTSVVNNGPGTLPANMKRYWVGSAAAPSYGDRGSPYLKNKPQTGVAPKAPVPVESVPGKGSEGGASNEIPKMFITPYQSLLSNMGDISVENPASPRESANETTLPERVPVAPEMPQKQPALQLKKKKQTKQPLLNIEKKLASLTKLLSKERKENAIQTMEVKKLKAKKMRNRDKPRIVAEITLNSSDDEQPQPAKPAKKQPSSLSVPLSDDETDEVIIIPTPPPPQICIDCSDEEEEQEEVPVAPPKVQFALPKSQKKKKKKKTVASPRCISPSNSSIMSDDFIVQHDRSRLNDSFTESIPNDDELDCSTEGAPRPGPSGKAKKKSAPEPRRERVPSISSEDTVCTSSETTDQDKRSLEAEKGEGAVKGKKDTPTTKKTPSKGKAAKAVPVAPSAETAPPTSASKSKGGSTTVGGTPSNDISNFPLTPRGKPKAQSKSPLTLVLECARERFDAEAKQSAKKVKSKKDVPVPVTAQEASSALGNSSRTADKQTAEVSEPVPSKSGSAGPKAKKKKNNVPIPPVDEVVSSESDYDMPLSTAQKASTPRTAGKKSRGSAASFFEQMGEVSSESDYDESFLQTTRKDNEKQKQAKESKKRLGRKRKQYNSETYSDEDFACLLTDIVRAVSDTEEEEEEEEVQYNDDATTMPENTSTISTKEGIDDSVTEQQTPSKGIRNPKKKKKLNALTLAAESGQALSAHTSNSEGQSEATVKKKKKAKEPKSSTKKVKRGIWCTTEEDFFVPTGQSNAVTTVTPVQQSQDGKKCETQSASNAFADETSSKVQTIADSDDEDDDGDDVRIIENSYSGRTSAASRASPFCHTATAVGPECAWNEEMKQFYNTSWTDEDFNLKSVLNQMPRDIRQWHILHKDRYPDPPKREIFCCICDERGHTKFKCRNKPKVPTCYMCGERGHREPRCPKTICLNCGAKTRNFVRGCKSCAKEADITCFSCGVRGHTQRSCPDLWRRYHSTIEDNVPLKEDAVKNLKMKWCCICGRPGHQAHVCHDAHRIFSHPIPNITVSSYMPAYRGEYNRGSKRQREEQQRRLAMDPTARYNLFSCDANECELNLPAVVQNENGFYYNFLRSTGMLERHERRSSQDEVEVVEQQETAPSDDEQLVMIESAPKEEPKVTHVVQSEIKEPSQGQSSTQATPEPCSNQTNSQKVALPIVEENSNYSFSEFNIEESDQNGTSEVAGIRIPQPPELQSPTQSNNDKQTLSDFIPLTVESNVPDFLALPPLPPRPPRPQRPLLPLPEQVSSPRPEPSPSPKVATPTPPPPQKSQTPQQSLEPDASGSTKNEPDTSKKAEQESVDGDGKVMLSKEHARLLLSEKGSAFLNEAGKRHTVKLSITFESIGNVLVIAGKAEAQDQFHQELVRYLKDMEPDTVNAKYNQVYCPKDAFKNARYVIHNLRRLVSGRESIRTVLAKFDEATTLEAREKYRRELNILLFGVYGLRDGRKHLNLLQAHLHRCRNIPGNSLLAMKDRITVNDAIRYIFTGYDHKDYAALVLEFERLQKDNKLKKVTFNDLGIHKMFPTLVDAPVHEFKQNNVHEGTQGNVSTPPLSVRNAKKGEKKHPKGKGFAVQNERFVKNGNRQRFNRRFQADEYFDDEMMSHENNSYVDDDFIMNTCDQQIDPSLLAQLDNSTRYASEPDWMTNGSNYHHQQQQQQQHQRHHPQHSSVWANSSDQYFRGSFNTGNNRDRYHWVRGGAQSNGSDQPGPASSDVARMVEREHTLRDRELNQLQVLQNLLR